MVDFKMANNEESVYSDPNFAVICSFVDKFGDLNGVTDFSIVDLQQKLENTKDISPEWIDFHVRLLRKAGRKSVSNDRWEKALIKFCHSYSKTDAWEIERFGYKKAKLNVKINVLKHLLEAQFDGNSKFKAEVNKFTSQQLRLLPVGRDINGQMYWYQIDKEFNLKVYREDQDDETWELVVSERSELAGLIDKLTNGSQFKQGESTTSSENDDSKDSSCAAKLEAEKPITDTGQGADSQIKKEVKSEDESSSEEEEKIVVNKDVKDIEKAEDLKLKVSGKPENLKVEKCNAESHSLKIEEKADEENCSATLPAVKCDTFLVKSELPVIEEKMKTESKPELLSTDISPLKDDVPKRASVIKMAEKITELPPTIMEELQDKSSSEHLNQDRDEPMDLEVKSFRRNKSPIVTKEVPNDAGIDSKTNESLISTPSVMINDKFMSDNERMEVDSGKERNEIVVSPSKLKLTDELKEKIGSERMIPFKKRGIPKDVESCNSNQLNPNAQDLTCTLPETTVHLEGNALNSASEVKTRILSPHKETELPVEGTNNKQNMHNKDNRVLNDEQRSLVPPESIVNMSTKTSPIKPDLPPLFQPQFLVNKPTASTITELHHDKPVVVFTSEEKKRDSKCEQPICLSKSEFDLKSHSSQIESQSDLKEEAKSKFDSTKSFIQEEKMDDGKKIEYDKNVLDLSIPTDVKALNLTESNSSRKGEASSENILVEIQKKSLEHRTKNEVLPIIERDNIKHLIPHQEKEGRKCVGKGLEMSLARIRERQEMAKGRVRPILPPADKRENESSTGSHLLAKTSHLRNDCEIEECKNAGEKKQEIEKDVVSKENDLTIESNIKVEDKISKEMCQVDEMKKADSVTCQIESVQDLSKLKKKEKMDKVSLKSPVKIESVSKRVEIEEKNESCEKELSVDTAGKSGKSQDELTEKAPSENSHTVDVIKDEKSNLSSTVHETRVEKCVDDSKADIPDKNEVPIESKNEILDELEADSKKLADDLKSDNECQKSEIERKVIDEKKADKEVKKDSENKHSTTVTESAIKTETERKKNFEVEVSKELRKENEDIQILSDVTEEKRAENEKMVNDKETSDNLKLIKESDEPDIGKDGNKRNKSVSVKEEKEQEKIEPGDVEKENDQLDTNKVETETEKVEPDTEKTEMEIEKGDTEKLEKVKDKLDTNKVENEKDCGKDEKEIIDTGKISKDETTEKDKQEEENEMKKDDSSEKVKDPSPVVPQTLSTRGRRGKPRGRGGSRGRGARSQTRVIPVEDKIAADEETDSSQDKSETTEESPRPKRGKGRGGGRGRGRIIEEEIHVPVKRSQRLQAQREKQQEVDRQMQEERRLLEEFELQQREEDQRRRQEQKDQKVQKLVVVSSQIRKHKGRRKKRGRPRKKDEDYEEDDDDDDDDEDDDDDNKENKKRKLKKKRKKQKGRRKGNNPWDYSSETTSSSSEQDENNEGEEDEDEELVFNDKSDHEFSPESDSEVDAKEPMKVRRARTARKVKSESDDDEASDEQVEDDKPCLKCGNYDHPEWILLCDKCNAGFHTACLRPPLLIIPDGDWFCPPCEHKMLLLVLQEHLKILETACKKREREEMRKKRLAYVGINLDNVLKPEKKEDQTDEEEEENQPKRSCRMRRDISYQFKEYDAMIQSAIQDEITAERGAGMGKGKDMSNIIEAEEEEEEEEDEEHQKENKVKEKEIDDDKGKENESQEAKKTEDTISEGAEQVETPTVPTIKINTSAAAAAAAAAARRRRKHRRLNDLESTDEEEEDNDSDEDFKESTDSNTPLSEEEDYDDEDYQEESEDSWKVRRSRSKTTTRRTSRARQRNRGYDSDFVVDDFDSEESDSMRVKRRAASKRVSYRELSDSDENETVWKKSAKKSRIETESEDSDWRELHRREKATAGEKSPKVVSKVVTKRRWASESDSESDIDDSDSISKMRGKKKRIKDQSESSEDEGPKKKRFRIKDFEKSSEEEESEDDNEEEEDDDDDDEDEDDEGEKEADADDEKNEQDENGGDGNETDDDSKKVSGDGTPLSISLDAALTPLSDMTPNQRSVIMSLKLAKKDDMIKTPPMGSNAQNAVGTVSADADLRTGTSDISEKDDMAKKDKIPSPRVETGLRPLVPPSHLPMDYRCPPPNPLRPSLMEPPMQRSSPSKLMLLDACPTRSSPHTRFTMLDLPYVHRSTPPSIPHRSTPPSIHHYDPKLDRPQAVPSPNRGADHPPPTHPSLPPPPPYMGDYPPFMAPPYYPPTYGAQASPHERYSPQGYHPNPPPPPPPPMHGQHPPYPPPYHQQSPHYSYGPEGYPEDDQYEGHSQPPYPPPYGSYSSPAEGGDSQPPSQQAPPPQQHNGSSYAVNNLLQRPRPAEGNGEEDEFNGVNDLVSYITGSHENQL